MASKYYAIKVGYDKIKNQKVQNIIVSSWGECLKYVKSVKGAIYKSFPTQREAQEYLDIDMVHNGVDSKDLSDYLHIYVDGSYNQLSKEYSYGLVVVQNDTIVHIESASFASENSSNIRQIAGELKAAICAVEYSKKIRNRKIIIYHDYMGIRNHATGEWSRKDESSLLYYEKMQQFMKEGFIILFSKVDSHTGDLYNEMADELCKNELHIESQNVVANFLRKNKIYVRDVSTKNKLLQIAQDAQDSILVRNDNICNEKVELDEIYNRCINSKSSHEIVQALSSFEKEQFIYYLLKKINNK